MSSIGRATALSTSLHILFARRNKRAMYVKQPSLLQPGAPLGFFNMCCSPRLVGARFRQLNGVGDKVSALHGREVSIGDLSAEVGQSRSGRGVLFAGEGGYRVGAREAGGVSAWWS